MMFEKYDAYKDSGIDWIGDIPAGWDALKLKNVAFINPINTALSNSLDKNTQVCFLAMENVEADGTVNYQNKRRLASVKSGFTNFIKNDVLVAKITPCFENGKGALLDQLDSEIGFGSTEFHVLRSKHNSHPKFLYYLTKSHNFMDFGEGMMIGSAGQKRVPTDFIENFSLALPNKTLQGEIAKFLDTKTSEIEQVIAIKEQQIVLLNERKQIVIQKAVTQGLDPNVPMKDSGVEWIGQIPEHWEIRANRTMFKERNEQGKEGLPLLSVSIHSGVSNEEISEEDNVRGRVKIEDKSKYILVKKGDIAFNMMRAWQGGIGAVSVDGMVSPAYIVAKLNDFINSEFFEYQYRCPEFIQQMDRYSKGITDFRKRLYWDGFKQLLTVVPPIDEQLKIVEQIKAIEQQTNVATKIKNQQIEKLKEYKTTLINDAVTGKIKVA